jgi:hypothetical protein
MPGTPHLRCTLPCHDQPAEASTGEGSNSKRMLQFNTGGYVKLLHIAMALQREVWGDAPELRSHAVMCCRTTPHALLLCS